MLLVRDERRRYTTAVHSRPVVASCPKIKTLYCTSILYSCGQKALHTYRTACSRTHSPAGVRLVVALHHNRSSKHSTGVLLLTNTLTIGAILIPAVCIAHEGQNALRACRCVRTSQKISARVKPVALIMPEGQNSLRAYFCEQNASYHGACSRAHTRTYRVPAAWTRGPTLATPRRSDGGPPPLHGLLEELKKGHTKSTKDVVCSGCSVETLTFLLIYAIFTTTVVALHRKPSLSNERLGSRYLREFRCCCVYATLFGRNVLLIGLL